MAHLHRLAYLLKKLNSETCSAKELEELDILLNDEQKTQQYFRESFEKQSVDGIKNIPSEVVWHGIVSKINVLAVRKRKSRIFTAIAATIVLLVGLGLLNWFSQKEYEWELVQNTSDKVKEVVLPDNSHVWLAERSSLSYASDFDQRRETKLTGRAFFKVVKKMKSPFSVEVGEVAIKVLGTSFNIKSEGSSVEVAVTTGLVEVSSQKQSVKLSSNQKVIYNSDSHLLQKSATNALLHTFWLEDNIILDKITLKELMPILAEKYDVSIIFIDKKAESTTLYNFRLLAEETLGQLMKRINYTNEVELRQHKNEIEIRQRE